MGETREGIVSKKRGGVGAWDEKIENRIGKMTKARVDCACVTIHEANFRYSLKRVPSASFEEP